jgi:hypothetical protein
VWLRGGMSVELPRTFRRLEPKTTSWARVWQLIRTGPNWPYPATSAPSLFFFTPRLPHRPVTTTLAPAQQDCQPTPPRSSTMQSSFSLPRLGASRLSASATAHQTHHRAKTVVPLVGGACLGLGLWTNSSPASAPLSLPHLRSAVATSRRQLAGVLLSDDLHQSIGVNILE